MRRTEYAWLAGSVGEEVQNHVKRCKRNVRRLLVFRCAVYIVVLTEILFRAPAWLLLASILMLLVLLPVVLLWKLSEERRLQRILARWHEHVASSKQSQAH